MRSTKDLLLYLSLVGMVGFAGLSYYLYKESVMSGKAAIFTSSKSGEQSAAPAGQTPTAGTDAQSSGVIDRDEDGTDTTQTAQAPAVIPEDKPVVPEVPTEEDRTGFQRASRIMGINTADVKEDTSSVQFVNIFKSAIPFYETTPWGSGKEVEYDAQGWPIDLHGGQALTKFLNRLPVNTVPDGFYTVLYDGKGTIHYGNDASLVAHREGMDIIEINEAFSAQVLACTRKMGIADDDSRINPNGGGIAIGHPLGMTGGRILQSAAIELQKTNKRYALVTMCIGVGQGYATVIERA